MMAQPLKRGRKKQRLRKSRKGGELQNIDWLLKLGKKSQTGGYNNIYKLMLKLGLGVAKKMGLKKGKRYLKSIKSKYTDSFL